MKVTRASSCGGRSARRRCTFSIGRALRRVRVDNAAALVQRYLVGSRGNGSLRPLIDSPLVFGKAILSLTLEGVGVLRMARIFAF